MKLKKSLYNILQYVSTINDIFPYHGNGVIKQKEKTSSGFVEVKIDGFFNKPFVIRSLSKFLRLFTFAKGDKGTDPESIEDWTLADNNLNPSGPGTELYLKGPDNSRKIQQASEEFLIKKEYNVRKSFDTIPLERSLKFQITNQKYRQIMTDCSLLDLDMVQFTSVSNSIIRITLRKKDQTNNKDTSTYDIEVDHEHQDLQVNIWLSTFNLIDATDHQIEFGLYKVPETEEDIEIPVVKTQSFYDNYIVKKVILGI